MVGVGAELPAEREAPPELSFVTESGAVVVGVTVPAHIPLDRNRGAGYPTEETGPIRTPVPESKFVELLVAGGVSSKIDIASELPAARDIEARTKGPKTNMRGV